jgi:hypothetical protein
MPQLRYRAFQIDPIEGEKSRTYFEFDKQGDRVTKRTTEPAGYLVTTYSGQQVRAKNLQALADMKLAEVDIETGEVKKIRPKVVKIEGEFDGDFQDVDLRSRVVTNQLPSDADYELHNLDELMEKSDD